MNGQDIAVEELEGLSNQERAEVIAEHFAKVSNEYSSLNFNNLPAIYLQREHHR